MAGKYYEGKSDYGLLTSTAQTVRGGIGTRLVKIYDFALYVLLHK